MVASYWKILLDCYRNEEIDEGINGCEDVSCPVKSNSPLSNAEVGDIEDLFDGKFSPCKLVEHTICCKHKISVYSLIVCHVPEQCAAH